MVAHLQIGAKEKMVLMNLARLSRSTLQRSPRSFSTSALQSLSGKDFLSTAQLSCVSLCGSDNRSDPLTVALAQDAGVRRPNCQGPGVQGHLLGQGNQGHGASRTCAWLTEAG